MSLKDFLHEERLERKKMRQERKAIKKQPKTKREKVYKIVGILFTIFVICGSLLFACNNMSKGYDWNTISGITEDISNKLELSTNTSLLLQDIEITQSDIKSCEKKFADVGIEYSQVDGVNNLTPSGDILFTSKEVGVVSGDILKSLNSDISYTILGLKIYNDINYYYQKCVIKVNLKSYMKNANLPDIYITTTSKCDILNEKLTALNYVSSINNLSVEESDEVFSVLKRNILTTDLSKIATDNVCNAVNILNVIMNTKLELFSDGVQFSI